MKTVALYCDAVSTKWKQEVRANVSYLQQPWMVVEVITTHPGNCVTCANPTRHSPSSRAVLVTMLQVYIPLLLL